MENGVSTIPGISGDIEACADVFYFSMGKHSGKFMINLDGSISAMGNNGGRYQVSLEDMKQFTSTGAQDTYIRITTDDGYVYTFGGQGYASWSIQPFPGENGIMFYPRKYYTSSS